MTHLEQTIIANARIELEAVLAYYRDKDALSPADAAEDAWRDYHGRYNAMHAFLMLAHQANSGMSAEGVEALKEIEAEHALAYRSMS